MGDFAVEVQDIAMRLECAVDNLDVIQFALEQSNEASEMYSNAIFSLYLQMSGLVEELKKASDDECARRRAKNGERKGTVQR